MIIYKITFPNKKLYIGQTVEKINIRLSHHKTDAKLKRDITEFNPQGSKIGNAIRRYGLENSWVEIIDKATDIEELNNKEDYWITFFKSTKLGYNIKPGGGNKRHSDITKQKIGLATKERWKNKDIANRMREGLKKGTATAKKNQTGKLRVERISIECPICGATFEARPKKGRKFCGRSCSAKHASNIAKLKNENVC